MKKNVFKAINKVDVKLAKVNKKAVAIVTTATALTTVAFCATSLERVQLDGVAQHPGSLAFGVLMLIGVFMAVTGIVALANAMKSDDHDQAAIGKAVGKLVSGAIMLAAPNILLAIMGASYDTLGTHFFAGF